MCNMSHATGNITVQIEIHKETNVKTLICQQYTEDNSFNVIEKLVSEACGNGDIEYQMMICGRTVNEKDWCVYFKVKKSDWTMHHNSNNIAEDSKRFSNCC